MIFLTNPESTGRGVSGACMWNCRASTGNISCFYVGKGRARRWALQQSVPCNVSVMEMASEKHMIANLKWGVEYDYSVSGSSHPSSFPGGNQRIPTYALPYQNLSTTQGLQVRILIKMLFKIKFLPFSLAWNFVFRFQCLPPSRKWKIICPDIFHSNTWNIQNTISSESLGLLCYKTVLIKRVLGIKWLYNKL